MEELCDDYFASMNPIANKIIEEKRKCKEKNRKNWERLTQAEKDSLLDEWFIDPDLKIRYEIRLQGQLPSNKDAPPESFPRLNLQGGTKTVQYTEHEDGSQSKGTVSFTNLPWQFHILNESLASASPIQALPGSTLDCGRAHGRPWIVYRSARYV